MLEPKVPVGRYERSVPGEMLHVETRKLGCIVRPTFRVTGNRREMGEGTDGEVAHVAIGDHSRAGFVQVLADQKMNSASPLAGHAKAQLWGDLHMLGGRKKPDPAKGALVPAQVGLT